MPCNVREREEVGRRRTGERFTALVHAHVAVNALLRVVRVVRIWFGTICSKVE